MSTQRKKSGDLFNLSAVLFILVCSLALSACGDSKTSEDSAAEVTTASSDKPRVGVLLYTNEDVYINLVEKSLVKAFEGKAELIVEYAALDQLTQNEQLEAVLGKNVAAMAVNLVDTQAAARVVDRIKRAGIPVVFFNREPDMNSIKTYDKARFVGTNANDSGVMQGDMIYKLWQAHPQYDRNKDGIVQYVMFQASTDNPEAVARTEYSVRRATELGLRMAQVGETYMCNWNEQLAREGMRLALVGSGADVIELVIANNDSMALGAVGALNENGYNSGDSAKYIPVVGVDATPQAVEAIENGRMSATVRQDAAGMAEVVAAMTLNAMAGKDFFAGTSLKYDESGVAVRIPYSPFYAE